MKIQKNNNTHDEWKTCKIQKGKKKKSKKKRNPPRNIAKKNQEKTFM